jgi:aryl-alcohol dehydrogenase-like predicted oxidoreductase
MLHLASINGIDTIDTAISYGKSESCLGELGTQGFKVVTKLPALPDTCADVSDWIRRQVAASMSRLGINKLHGLLLHKPEQLLSTHGSAIFRSLRQLQDDGHVQKIGVSIYSPNELEAIIPKFRFDLVQAPYNLVDRRIFSSGLIQRLKDDDVEVHTRSAFLQGLLLMAPDEIPTKFAPWSELWRRWHAWLAVHETSALQACLAFALDSDEIDRVIFGADSIVHVAQILAAAGSEPTGNFAALQCEDEGLINPAYWPTL